MARRLLGIPGIAARSGMAANVLARSGARKEAEEVTAKLLALPERTWSRSTALAMAYAGLGDTARAVSYMERAAAGDGDLLVLYANPMANQVPRGARTDAVWRRFNLDPASIANRDAGGRK